MKKYFLQIFWSSIIGLSSQVLLFENAWGQVKKVSLSYKSSHSRIINGKPVLKSSEDFRKAVRIINFNKDGLWVPECTGVPFGNDLVITAAHCIYGKDIFRIQVSYNAQPFTAEQQYYEDTRIDPTIEFYSLKIKDVFIHPKYSVINKNSIDLAVLRLESFHPVEYRNQVEILTSLDQLTTPETTIRFYIMGYGAFAGNPAVESDTLRGDSVTGTLSGDFLFVNQNEGLGGCYGDSGGPAFFRSSEKSYLIGITIGGIGDSPYCDQVGKWLFVPNFVQFINKLK